MKKIFAITAASVLLMWAIAAGVSAASDAAMNAVYGTPKVDGAIDEIWATAECQDITLVDKAVIPSDSKTTGKFRTMWDENYFYVLVEVDKAGMPVCVDGNNENNADCADVCITMDGNFNAALTESGEFYAGVMRVTADGTQSGFGYMFDMFEDEYLSVMKTTSDSTYVVEYGIPWDDIKPVAGHVLSMDIQINDATDDARTGLVTWAATPCYCWQSSAEHGTITLVEAASAEPANGVIEATEGFSGEGAENLFDGDETTKWCLNAAAPVSVTWKTDAVTATGYEIVTANDNAEYTGRNPGSWTLYGSNDGANWTALDAVEADNVLADVNFTPFTFAIDAPAEYAYYKFEVTSIVGGGVMQISGLNLLTGDVVPYEPAAEEEVVVEEPVVEEPAAEEPVVEAPQTFDLGVIAAIAAIVSAAGYAVSKKR